MTRAELQNVFETNKDAVYGFAWRMTGSDSTAEDIAQDCFLQLLHRPMSYDSTRGPLRAWLLGIARNLILKRWRADGRWTALDDDAFSVAPAMPDCRSDQLVADAVQALPPLQREVVILIEYEGLTLQEAAQAVDADVGTVKARLHRARTKLRQMLEPLRSAVHER